MSSELPGRKNSNTKMLEELEELSQTLYLPHTTTTSRRTNSLVLPRESVPTISSTGPFPVTKIEPQKPHHSRPRRMSLSPWRSRPKADEKEEDDHKSQVRISGGPEIMVDSKTNATEKKGIWNWKPIRALSHIKMQKLSCLFSVEVVTAQGLPASMNGLRLSVCVRKKETKDGAVQTMPARVLQGAADFEETLFFKCHVYCDTGKHMKFEPRPFLIYVFAVDAEELDFGRSHVDLSLLIQESMEKNLEGTRVRQWDTSFYLSGKAKGGELVLKLGFQIMEKDGGAGIYNSEGLKISKGGDSSSSSSFARKQSKSSFSVPSPRLSSKAGTFTPSKALKAAGAPSDLHGIDELNLDEPASAPVSLLALPPIPAPSPVPAPASSLPPIQKPEEVEDLDLPDFEIVDKGVEILDKTDGGESEEATDEGSISNEVVKEVVEDEDHKKRLIELDAIAQQIKALENMIRDDISVKSEASTETGSQRLDADEENVTKEFLQMLECEEDNEFEFKSADTQPPKKSNKDTETKDAEESIVYVPDLGKGLGCVVQTKHSGFLAATNPFDVEVPRKETPKLAMQLSKTLVLPKSSMSGFEVFQQMASIGIEELASEVVSMMPMDELVGKTAEQIAFEGIASAIIQGRSTTEGASSSAAKTVTAVKTMANAMNSNRKERISTGIWNVNEDAVTLDEILALSLQKIEAMAVEALKIMADMSEEDSPFDVSPQKDMDMKGVKGLFTSAVPLEDWLKDLDGEHEVPEKIILSIVVQLRDPLRRYEVVGGPIIALIQAAHVETTYRNEEEKFKVSSLHVGGLKVRAGGKRHMWDAEKQRLTAMQWLVAYGLGKAGKKGRYLQVKGPDSLWSTSSRVMADMWLKPMRNPDVKFPKKQ